MRVLLVRPHTEYLLSLGGGTSKIIKGVELELGLLYLASYLEKSNIDVRVLDLLVENRPDALSCELKEFRPDIVGVTAYTNFVTPAHAIAKFAKKESSAVTIVGGAHPSALPERTLKEFRYFDYLVHGEGELTLLEFVKSLEKGKELNDIKGLAYRKGGQIIVNPAREPITNLDALPFPVRHLVDIKKYVPPAGNYYYLPATGILGSRGCPFRCTFCARIGSRYRKLRTRSIKNIIEEIEYCIETFGIQDFRFYDDTFTMPRERIENFCNTLIDKKLNIKWNCFTRVDVVDEKMLRLMKDAGCYHIKYGVESGNEQMLIKIKKGATLQQARNAVKWAKEEGIEVKASFIIGFPDETVKEIQQTIDFAKEISPDYATFAILAVLPGSEIFNNALQNKQLLHMNWNVYFDRTAPVLINQLDPETLKLLLKKAYREFYMRPSFFVQTFKRVFKNPNLREFKNLVSGARTLIGI